MAWTNNSMSSRCLLILGMHRSGTSALTRCLNLLGMDVGSNLLAPNQVNARGFWEHADAVRINDGLLQSFGLQWHSLDPLPVGWLQSESANQARAEILALVERDFRSVPLWGIKDPRMCRLAPLWIQTLQEQGVDVSAVFASRSPVEVAHSLERAHKLQLPISVLMWMQHLAESERATRGLRRSMTRYEDLLADPCQVMAHVGNELAIDWPMSLQARRESIQASLESSLRTHYFNMEDMSLPSLVYRMFDACQQGGGWEALSALSEEANQAVSLIAYRLGAESPDDRHRLNTLRRRQYSPVTAKLFIARDDSDSGEERAESRHLEVGRNRVEWTLTGQSSSHCRLDPVSHAGYYLIHSIGFFGRNGQLLSNWPEISKAVSGVGIRALQRPTQPGQKLHYLTTESRFSFSLTDDLLKDASTLILDIERFDAETLAGEWAAQNAILEQEHSMQERQRLTLEKEREHLEAELRRERNIQGEIEHQASTLHQQNALIQHHGHLLGEIYREVVRKAFVLRSLSKSGVLARFTRRFLKVSLRLIPQAQLERLENMPDAWTSTGDDPQFRCESVRFPLPPGWYAVDLRMGLLKGDAASPVLYPEYGPDQTQGRAGINLHFFEANLQRHRGIVFFAHPVYALRFDPSDEPCNFTITGLSIRYISP